MGDAKNIIIKPIAKQDADKIVKSLHYSGKVVNNSQLHLGVFYEGRCGGAMQFGPPLFKKLLINLVKETLWNEFIELNRMAFADWLPRNSESRAIAYAMKFIKKTYPHIKWVVSFADGMQCGDGTIYRASGFVLTGFSSGSMWILPPDLAAIYGAPIAHTLAYGDKSSNFSKEMTRRNKGKNYSPAKNARIHGGKLAEGYMLRYIYFIDPTAKERLTVPILSFSEIEKRGAGMYKGIKRDKQATGNDQLHSGGAAPTVTLQTKSKIDK